MLTAGANAIAMARFETIRLLHGQCDGLLMMSLTTVGAALFSLMRAGEAKRVLH